MHIRVQLPGKLPFGPKIRKIPIAGDVSMESAVGMARDTMRRYCRRKKDVNVYLCVDGGKRIWRAHAMRFQNPEDGYIEVFEKDFDASSVPESIYPKHGVGVVMMGRAKRPRAK